MPDTPQTLFDVMQMDPGQDQGGDQAEPNQPAQPAAVQPQQPAAQPQQQPDQPNQPDQPAQPQTLFDVMNAPLEPQSLFDVMRASEDPRLQEMRSRIANSQERGMSWFGRRGIAVFSPVVEAKNAVYYGRSLQAVNAGTGTDEDIDRVATHERLQELDEQNEGEHASLWNRAQNFAVRGAEMLTTAFITGGTSLPAQGASIAPRLLSTAGLRALATRAGWSAAVEAAPRYAMNRAAATAANPSFYLPQWIENNRANNRDATDIRGLPPAFALGWANNMVLGSLGEVGQSIPGSTIGRTFARLGAASATGMLEQQAVNALASASQDTVEGTFGYSLGLPTNYGTIGNMVGLYNRRGQPGAADRLTHELGNVGLEALGFAAFAGLHEVQHGAPRREPQISESGRQFLNEFQSVANTMHSESRTPAEFREVFQTAHDRITHELEHQQARGQELDLASMRRTAESIENPQSRQLAEAMVKVFEDRAAPAQAEPRVRNLTPEQPSVRQVAEPGEQFAPPPDQQAERQRRLVQGAEAMGRLAEPSPTSEAQRPAERSPEARTGQNWHEEYRNQRQRGLSHEEAIKLADKKGPQEWHDTGTRFTERPTGEVEFSGKDGKKYTIHHEIREVKGEDGKPQKAIYTFALDGHGEEVSHVLFDRRGKARGGHEIGSDYSGGMVETVEGLRNTGLANALYDYAHNLLNHPDTPQESRGRILASDSQTGNGKTIWEANANRAMRERATSPAAKPEPAKPPEQAKVKESLAEKKTRIAAEKAQKKAEKAQKKADAQVDATAGGWLGALGLDATAQKQAVKDLRARGSKLASPEETIHDYARMVQEAGAKNVKPPEVVAPEGPVLSKAPEAAAAVARLSAEHQEAARHIVREMAVNPDVGTTAEFFRAINEQRKNKGLAKMPFEKVKKAFDAMEKAGLVDRFTFEAGEDPIYAPREKPPNPRTEEEKQQLYAETRAKQRAYEESLRADATRAERGSTEPSSVRRNVERDVSKADEAIAVTNARREAEEAAQRNAERGAAAAGRSEAASDVVTPEMRQQQGAEMRAEREKARQEREHTALMDEMQENQMITGNERSAMERIRRGEGTPADQEFIRTWSEKLTKAVQDGEKAARNEGAGAKVIEETVQRGLRNGQSRQVRGAEPATPAPGAEAPVGNQGPNGAPAAPANAGAGSGVNYSKPIEPSQPVRILPDDLPNGAGGPGGPRRGIAGRGTVIDSVPVPPGNEFAESLARGVLRHKIAEQVSRMDKDRHAMDAARKFFEVHIEAAPEDVRQQRFVEFFRAVESGEFEKLPAEQRQFAEIYRKIHDAYTKELVDRDLVRVAIENHVGHAWEDPNRPNASPMDIALSLLSRRPLAGKEGFRRERTIPTYEDGIAAGLKPRSWNPATLALIEFDQYSKSIFGHDAFHTMRDLNLIQYVPVGQRSAEGWRTLTDRQFRELGIRNNVTTIKEVFDKQQMQGLENFARSLGVDIEHAGKIPAPGGEAFGRHEEGKITRRFGTPEEVLAHEIGHELDRRYNLSSWVADPALAPELQSLADLRASGRPSADVQDYLRRPAEQAANLITAYLHTPELLAKNAPQVKAKLDALIESRPELHALREIKPSLELGERDQVLRLQGQAITGHYYMPDPVAKLFENHMMPGLASTPGAAGAAYRAFRGFGNQMSQFLLGWSGFHATGVTLNAQFSKMAELIGMGTRGNFSGQTLLEAVIPGYAAVEGVRKGLKIRKEWDSPGSQSPEYAEMARYLRESGGRVRGGSDYVSSSIESFSSAMRRLKAGDMGQIPRALFHAIPALNELVSKPVMDYLVPSVKAGVWMDAFKYELQKNPKMTVEQRREVGGKIWDAMEDRFGLLTYDNLFMNRVVRDTLQTSMLSFGWNLGDVRGLGGGLVDALKPSMWRGLARGEGVSRRTAFLISLMAGSAIYGSLYQLGATGKAPEEARDMWFPRTGQNRADGTPDRVSLPTYMKDLAAVTNRATDSPLAIPRNLWHMASNKISPAVRLVGEILTNQDWQGRAIDNPNDPVYMQARDQAMHILKALVPISVSQGMQQNQRGASLPRQLQGLVGITPAPGHIVHSWEQQRAQEVGRRYQMTPQERRRRGLAR